MNKIELLAPAGSLITLKAAVLAGADAVYLGMEKFNAREFALNFSKEYLKQAIQICKSNNVKIYLTANTLVKNSEINEFLEMTKYAYECGIDSVIIQDPSFIEIIRKSFPELKIHMSTQTGIMNSYQANLFDADRIVLARELNKSNLESIRANCKKEIEVFVHGALCACVSGSCLFSSFIGGRSGNRGKCAQPCRKQYDGSFLISPKELCLLEKIPELIKLNINSLKIEGRMRTPYYVYTTTSVYRKAIDMFYENKFQVTQEMKSLLESAFSRDFTQGKFSNQNIFNSKKASGTSNPIIKNYEPLVKPIEIEKRTAIINLPNIAKTESSKKQLIVRVYNKKDAITADKYADIVCIDLFNPEFSSIKQSISKPLYAVTPRIMFDSYVPVVENKIKQISPSGLVIGNSGLLKLKLNIPIILDYNSNCFNDLQVQYYFSLKAKPIISPELSLTELAQFKNKNFIMLVHGRIRLMTLAHEFPYKQKENKDNQNKKIRITDEKGFDFFINKIENGFEIINEKELGLFNKLKSILQSGINQFYIDTDNSYNLETILKAYRDILDGKQIDTTSLQKPYVLGWAKRGVE